MNHTEEKLGTESLGSLMLSMGIPTLVAQMINLLYNIVDRVYIGQGVGREALTGLGLALPAITIVSAFSALAGAGGAPLAAIELGQGNREKAERITGNVFTLLCVFSAIVMLVFYAAQKPFLYMVGASDATYPYASEYLSIYLIGTICVQIVLGLNPFITAQGQSKTAMGSVLIGAALNIVLDPIFIFVFHMGVKGAALATILSQLAGAIWVLHFMTSKKTSLRLKRACLKPDFPQIGAILSLGMAPFIMQSTESLISIVMSSGLQRYGGDLYVGSLTILQSIMQLTSAPINGFTQGVQPILSYNFGAGDLARVKAGYRRIIGITAAVSFAITLLEMLFPEALARMFTQDEELIALVGRVAPVFLAGMLLFGIQMGCQTTFMGLGQAKISLFVAMLRKVILLVPFALIFPLVTGNVYSIYFAECMADIISVTTCTALFVLKIRKILERGPGYKKKKQVGAR